MLLLCLVLLTGQQYAAGVLSLRYQYVPEADTWLRLHLVPATWQDARQRCQLEGGILASPSSSALIKAMLAMMKTHKLQRPVFTGIHGLVSEGEFMSLDGAPLEDIYLDWAQGEPNDQNEDGNCLVLNPTADVADVSCASIAYPYFCRKDNTTMEINQECGTTASGYVYYARTGSCYKFHHEAKTWHHAAKVCHAEGGHLAIINNVTEVQVIKEIFEKHPIHTVLGAQHNFVTFIGFWKWRNNKDEKWLTIHGQTLKEAGYEQWQKYQPNNLGGVQNCGAIERDGSFNDLASSDREAFICEITYPVK